MATHSPIALELPILISWDTTNPVTIYSTTNLELEFTNWTEELTSTQQFENFTLCDPVKFYRGTIADGDDFWISIQVNLPTVEFTNTSSGTNHSTNYVLLIPPHP